MADSPFRSTPSSKRRDMYKKTTPSWKDAYRKRCFDRLRGSRESLLQRFRGTSPSSSQSTASPSSRIGSSPGSPSLMVTRVMEEEWRLLTREDPSFALIEDELDLREELQEELMKEEMSIISEYETSLRLEEEQLQDTVNHFTEGSVVCPLCQRNWLLMNKGIVFCSCGLRIDTAQDGLNLENIGQTLELGVSQHSILCPVTPVFALLELERLQNLVMSCETCGFLHIVI
ncbi:RPA-interacting protein B [Strongylocentrotus purpuratus]|uniref:RPA-interacting protein n=1 Tax=Strongylocentrotus purpuratus TaxID=7668 RepID=A0A7M7PA50_STRPU|nr:RPA-interacting protein B [Strongylocentrotus purpuratus]